MILSQTPVPSQLVTQNTRTESQWSHAFLADVDDVSYPPGVCVSFPTSDNSPFFPACIVKSKHQACILITRDCM